MSSTQQIKARLESLRRQYEDGNIGWSNYKQAIEKLFDLLIQLVGNVAELEAKATPPNVEVNLSVETKEKPDG